MLGADRRNRIIMLLHEKKSLYVQEIAKQFSVTEETIRRDFKILEKSGALVRAHGGAVLADDIKTEVPLVIREKVNVQGKDAIGKRAAQLVEDYDTIMLDASTSALFVAKHIKDRKGLTVITNAERVILELSSCEDMTLISTGGILRQKSLSYVGRSAESAVRSYYAKKLFFSSKGFSPFRGLTDSTEQESEVRKIMMACSEQKIYLCDYTKFDKVGYINTAKIDELDVIITDRPMPSSWIEPINSYPIQVIQA